METRRVVGINLDHLPILCSGYERPVAAGCHAAASLGRGLEVARDGMLRALRASLNGYQGLAGTGWQGVAGVCLLGAYSVSLSVNYMACISNRKSFPVRRLSYYQW